MTRKTHGGKGDRIPGACQCAYEANYGNIDWNARDGVQQMHGDAPEDGAEDGPGPVQPDTGEGPATGPRA